MKDICRVVWDERKRKYYSFRPDCPGEELKEISLGAILNLLENVQRYESDGWNEQLSKKRQLTS